jgi:hypothetical protein
VEAVDSINEEPIDRCLHVNAGNGANVHLVSPAGKEEYAFAQAHTAAQSNVKRGVGT